MATELHACISIRNNVPDCSAPIDAPTEGGPCPAKELPESGRSTPAWDQLGGPDVPNWPAPAEGVRAADTPCPADRAWLSGYTAGWECAMEYLRRWPKSRPTTLTDADVLSGPIG